MNVNDFSMYVPVWVEVSPLKGDTVWATQRPLRLGLLCKEHHLSWERKREIEREERSSDMLHCVNLPIVPIDYSTG